MCIHAQTGIRIAITTKTTFSKNNVHAKLFPLGFMHMASQSIIFGQHLESSTLSCIQARLRSAAGWIIQDLLTGAFQGLYWFYRTPQEHTCIISSNPYSVPLEAYVRLLSLEYPIFSRDTVFSSIEYSCP